ncbi:MAG: ABC transporter permease [Frankia sp.]|nr:ABC transporter permease [Frankia sp.]
MTTTVAPARPWPGATSAALIWRSLRRLPRQPDSLITSVALPVMLLLMFVYVFGGAYGEGGDRHAYLTYVVPGIIVLAATWGAASTAVAVAGDKVNGIFDRLRSMPVRGSAALTGHAVASLAANTVATALVIGLALAIGYRPHAGFGGWLGALGVLACYVVATTWVAIALGLLAASVDAANGLTFLVLFLPYVSSGFAPTDTMPSGLRAFAEHQPLTPTIDTVRGLLNGTGADGGQVVVALAWLAGITLVARLAAALLFRRRAGRP